VFPSVSYHAEYMTRLEFRKAAAAVLSGILIALAMPGFGFVPLLFVGLVPLFYAIEGRRRIIYGVLFGVTFFALDQRWILTVFRFSPLVAPGFAILVLYLALYCGAFGLLVAPGRDRRFGADLVLAAPAFLTLLEFARAQGPIGTAFSGLYHALYRAPSLVQIAAVLGPWAVTALVVFVNASIYLAVRRRRAGYALLAACGVGLLAAFSVVPVASDDGRPIDVAIVSSDVGQEVKLDARNLEALADRYEALGRRALETRPDLVVFPESILPAFILTDPTVLDRLIQLARDGRTNVLFGTGVYEHREVRNVVALLSPDGEILGTYAMVRPVPFGETIPGRRLWETLGLAGLMDSFLPVDLTPGDAFAPIEGIGTPICFESTFPAPARAFVRGGAEILAVVTNDAWFVGSSELAAHFASAVFRAVETRRYVVHSANGGISGIVDPRGRILVSTIEEGATAGTVRIRNDLTPYARWGDGPLLVLLGIAGLASFVIRVRRRSGAAKRSGE
jgi:apolipoprotein N-acyltransferase